MVSYLHYPTEFSVHVLQFPYASGPKPQRDLYRFHLSPDDLSFSNIILPSGPMLAVLIWSGFVTCLETSASDVSVTSRDDSEVKPPGASAISLTSRFVRTSLSLTARVCSKSVAGP